MRLGVQSILQERQGGKRSDQSKAYADSWIGHHLISPTTGKAEVQSDIVCCGHVFGGVLAPHVTDTDFGRVGRRPIGSEMSSGHSLHDTVDRLHEVSQGDPAGQDWRARVKSRRHFDCTPRTRPIAADIMYRRVPPIKTCENGMVRWTEDGPIEGRAKVPTLQPPDPDGGVYMKRCQSVVLYCWQLDRISTWHTWVPSFPGSAGAVCKTGIPRISQWQQSLTFAILDFVLLLYGTVTTSGF